MLLLMLGACTEGDTERALGKGEGGLEYVDKTRQKQMDSVILVEGGSESRRDNGCEMRGDGMVEDNPGREGNLGVANWGANMNCTAGFCVEHRQQTYRFALLSFGFFRTNAQGAFFCPTLLRASCFDERARKGAEEGKLWRLLIRSRPRIMRVPVSRKGRPGK